MRTRLSFCRSNNNVDFVSASSKCALYSETGQTRLGFVLLALSTIKTKSTSSKCTYVLNGNSKSTGETAQMDRLARAFPARICNENQHRLFTVGKFFN